MVFTQNVLIISPESPIVKPKIDQKHYFFIKKEILYFETVIFLSQFVQKNA